MLSDHSKGFEGFLIPDLLKNKLMKNICYYLGLMCLLTVPGFGQTLSTTKGEIVFFSNAPLEDIDFTKPGSYVANATGMLTIHGVDQKRTLSGKVMVAEDGSIQVLTKFNIMLADHKIEIPKLVFNKIAEKIAVSTAFSYQPFKK